MSATISRLYPYCPFCEKKLVTAKHLQECSWSDAREKLSESGHNPELFETIAEQIFFAKKFGEVYDAADDSQKDRMWVCSECYNYGFVSSSLFPFPTSCCGCGQIEAARAHLARPIKEEK